MHPAFAQWDLAALADGLARAVDEHRAQVEPAAVGKHEVYIHQHKARVHLYQALTKVPPSKPFGEVFPTWESFVAALRDQSPGALELGLELLARVDPAAALPFALTVIELQPPPWHHLLKMAIRALVLADDLTALRTLIAAARDGHDLALASLGGSRCAAGAPLFLELFGESERLTDAAIRYFTRWKVEAGWPLVAAEWKKQPKRHTGLCLLDYGDERSFALLESGLDGTRLQRDMAVTSLVKRGDPIERLGGVDALSLPALEELAAAVMDKIARALKNKAIAPAPEQSELARRWAKSKNKPTKEAAQFLSFMLRKRAPQQPPRAPVARAVRKPWAPMLAVMTRARSNLERIVRELKKQKYVFVRPRAALDKPTAKSKKDVARLEKLVGPLPASLRAAYEVIVGCDLRGSHKSFARPACLALPGVSEGDGIWHTDPFALSPASAVLDDAEDQADDEPQLDLPLSGDAVAKAGYSGGLYTMLVPNEAEDSPIQAADFSGTLVEYLRHVFAWGGFPGFARIEAPLPDLVSRLRELCEPI